jgi:four helix bundle protein
MKESIVKIKSLEFAKRSIDLYKLLITEKEYILSKQFLRSATSIGANINEALAGISKKDFIAKMSISSKEARETLYWIELIQYSKIIDFDFTEIEVLNNELIKMLTSIVKSSQLNINNGI